VAEHIYGRINANRLKVEVSCPLLTRKFTTNAFFVHQYGQRSAPQTDDVVVDSQLLNQFPLLLSKRVATRSMSDYAYLVGKRYIDDEAYVKWVREPYS
jgi:hypothetical protein